MTTLARPYALAAFEYAQDKKALSAWEVLLVAAAAVVQDLAVARLLARPETTAVQLSKLFCDVLTTILDQEKRNFIDLLAENKRLVLLPDIADLFKLYRAALEKTLEVKVITAKAIDEKIKNKIKEALAKRLKRQISMKCEIDSSLIGGVIVCAEDKVIDGSVQGQLKRLLNSLSS